MTCDEVAARIDELIDGSLGGGEREGVTDHAAGCPRCRKEIAAALAVAAATARLPRAIEPARDLWPGIAARLTGGQVVHGEFTPATRRLGVRWWLPAAAALAGAVGLWFATRATLPQPAGGTAASSAAPAGMMAGQTPASDVGAGTYPEPVLSPSSAVNTAREAAGAATGAVSGPEAAMAGATRASLLPAAESYRQARASLQAELAARGGALQPSTRRVVDENLAVIDRAVAAIETALASDPGNRSLEVLLIAAQGQEIQLLQQAAQLAAGNRQGGQA